MNNAATTVILTSGNAVIQANFAAAMEGSFTINNENTNTLSETVTLQMAISGATEMRCGNTPGELNAATWETYAESKVWNLTPEIGLKAVYGEFRDEDGHMYETMDDIRLIKKIMAKDGAAYDRFGVRVVVSADESTIVVGAYNDDDSGNDSGSVYVYHGKNWK